MEHTRVGDVCKIRLPLPDRGTNKPAECAKKAVGRRVENVRNCDIYASSHHFLIYADVQLLKYQSERPIDLKALTNLTITFNAPERQFELDLPVLPASSEEGAVKSNCIKSSELDLRLWKLKRITDRCQLLLHDAKEPLQFEANFAYGFASNYTGKIIAGESELTLTTPHLMSPLQRSITRELDEMKNFSREQYKCDFLELQVPEGHENPVKYTFSYDAESNLTREEECLLHNLNMRNKSNKEEKLTDCSDTAEIDCGLLNILMGICYDIRTTGNDVTCVSPWTRSTLSAVLCFFEPFLSIRATVISFMRRALTYPLYRNYDFARLCVEDLVKGLQNAHGKNWVLKQLLVTHEIFAGCESEVYNRYYIEDYIRYVHGVSPVHLQMLARNLKNILFDDFKQKLGLDLVAIETELLKELITDGTSEEEEESEIDDEDDEDEDEDDDEEESMSSSSNSDTEENSVIEQHMANMFLA